MAIGTSNGEATRGDCSALPGSFCTPTRAASFRARGPGSHQSVGERAEQHPEHEKWHRGKTRNQCQTEEQRRGCRKCLGLGENLAADIAAEMAAFFFGGDARDENAGCSGNDQGGNLCHQTFADGQ